MQLSLGLSRSPLESVRDALLCEFGPQRPVARMDPISQLVKSSISGRTPDAVSWAAFLRLRAEFSCWEDLAQATEAQVLEVIGDRVLRPALVGVATGGPRAPAEPQVDRQA